MNSVLPTISPHNNMNKVFMAEGTGDAEAEGSNELFGDDEDQEAEVIDVMDDDAQDAAGCQDREGAATKTLPDPGDPTESQKGRPQSLRPHPV